MMEVTSEAMMHSMNGRINGLEFINCSRDKGLAVLIGIGISSVIEDFRLYQGNPEMLNKVITFTPEERYNVLKINLKTLQLYWKQLEGVMAAYGNSRIWIRDLRMEDEFTISECIEETRDLIYKSTHLQMDELLNILAPICEVYNCIPRRRRYVIHRRDDDANSSVSGESNIGLEQYLQFNGVDEDNQSQSDHDDILLDDAERDFNDYIAEAENGF